MPEQHGDKDSCEPEHGKGEDNHEPQQGEDEEDKHCKPLKGMCVGIFLWHDHVCLHSS